MKKSLDFIFIGHETKHKSKPTQFMSVAAGVQKRRQSNLKHRKSCRLTVFDNVRDLSASDSPKKVINEAEQKIEHRRQQLEKWKAEKEMKKKQQAMQKKKPFVAGVVHAPLKFVPPPPPKAAPSTSGRVTRSQSAKVRKQKEVKEISFAPMSYSTFKPPQIKTTTKLPAFPSTKSRQKPSAKVNVTFEPIVPNKVTKEPAKVTRTTRSNTNVKNKVTATDKPSPKKAKKMPKLVESSSESNTEAPVQEKPKKRLSRKSSTQNFLIETINRSPILENRSVRKSVLNTTSESQESIVLPSRKTLRKSLQAETNNTPKSKKKNKTPKNKSIPKSESNSEEKLRSPKEILPSLTPEQIERIVEKVRDSPNVTMSRGKENARRETKKKLEEGLLDEDASCSGSVEHFRHQMDSEIRRMTLVCEEWDEIYEQNALPEFVKELVRTAVGQSRLLMSQKMRQFAGLVARCESQDSAAGMVTPADLAGFWDMLFIQIVNIDMRFKHLASLRARDWLELPPPPKTAKVTTKPTRKRKQPTGNSKIREMIAAARKAKKDQESGTNTSASSVSPISVPSSLMSPASDKTSELDTPAKLKTGRAKSSTPDESETEPAKSDAGPAKSESPAKLENVPAESDSKTFEAGFFKITSPIRTPVLRTPARKTSLLKSVLSSEARKASASKNSPASFAMLRASLMSKNVEIEGVSPLEQTPKPKLPEINLDATPARSILKSAQKSKKSSKKSIKTVLFDKPDVENSPYESAKDFTLLEITPNKVKEAADSGLSSMDVEADNKENKKTSEKKRRSRLTRQYSIEFSPVMTRLRRKSLQTPENNVLQHIAPEKNITPEENITPKRSSRRNKSLGSEKKGKEDLIDLNTPKEIPKRTRRARKTDV